MVCVHVRVRGVCGIRVVWVCAVCGMRYVWYNRWWIRAFVHVCVCVRAHVQTHMLPSLACCPWPGAGLSRALCPLWGLLGSEGEQHMGKRRRVEGESGKSRENYSCESLWKK